MKNFKNLIVLSPLIYALHHFEEHVVFNFREWRLRYFANNNPSSTEEVLIILISLLLIMVFIHLIKNNRASAHIVLFFLMTTQIVNALFHIFFSFYYYDFSPGVITAILLYLPVNFFIIKASFKEGYLKNKTELCILFVLGMSTFALFEVIGPVVILNVILLCPLYYLVINKIEKA